MFADFKKGKNFFVQVNFSFLMVVENLRELKSIFKSILIKFINVLFHKIKTVLHIKKIMSSFVLFCVKLCLISYF